MERIRFDPWLEHYFGDLLGEIEAEASRGPGDFTSLFGRITDDDLWAVLLSKRYEGYPRIRAALPDWTDEGFEQKTLGRSGIALARQTRDFCRALATAQDRHGGGPLRSARVLDFGCGWGRITRFVARDVPAEQLYGCDDNDFMVRLCRRLRVPGTFEVSETLPERLPFETRFDLVFAFSVFTHLEEEAHLACLRAIQASLEPGGLAVVTVRPPPYLREQPALRSAAGESRDVEYSFAPGSVPPVDGAVRYGEAVVPMEYVRRRWSELFEVVEAKLMLDDPYQVPIVLRKPS